MASWIVCQLGAREHYAVARSLHQTSQLRMLVTDAWSAPTAAVHRLPGKVSRALGDRYHLDLAAAPVSAFTRSLLAFELGQRLAGASAWSQVMARNEWFQHRALRILKQLEKQLSPHEQPVLFSYSYTAIALFRYAKQRGWRTILGQIDPGLTEQNQVAELQAFYGHQYASKWVPAPDSYWQSWRQECELADSIMVNSVWSQQALSAANVDASKVAVAPLAYCGPATAKAFTREYPAAFTSERPLRVLFLGQIILRKGIAAVIEAIATLTDQPIEIWLVGSTELDLTATLDAHPQLKWVGALPRSQVQQYYQQADVFLFPTHSDGFGLTQLEAQAWKLPIIASRYCGEVVTHQQNGLVLSEVSGEAIAAALRECCQHPLHLQRWSGQAINMNCYDLPQLAKTLQNLAHAPV